MLLAKIAYWTVLLASHRHQLQFTEEQTWLRAAQMSRAVSVQVETVLSALDHTMRNMQADLEAGNQEALDLAAKNLFESYPKDSIVQVAAFDKDGRVVYSNMKGSPARWTAYRDRTIAFDKPGSVSGPLLGVP